MIWTRHESSICKFIYPTTYITATVSFRDSTISSPHPNDDSSPHELSNDPKDSSNDCSPSQNDDDSQSHLSLSTSPSGATVSSSVCCFGRAKQDPMPIKQKRITMRARDAISQNPNVVPKGTFAIASEVCNCCCMLKDAAIVGFDDGCGKAVGCKVGRRDGRDDGEDVGDDDGKDEGLLVGCELGRADG